jgi:ATP-dependent helicase Lhr and Lhr-like helicase
MTIHPFVLLSVVEGSDTDIKGEVCSKDREYDVLVIRSLPASSGIGMTRRRKSRENNTQLVIGKKTMNLKTREETAYAIGMGKKWFERHYWKPFDFQIRTWKALLEQQSGLLNAPTGSGKTYALWIGCLMEYLLEKRRRQGDPGRNDSCGLRILWITPLRALTKDIRQAMVKSAEFYAVPWEVRIRTGDTTAGEKKKIRDKPPECLITTPESLHLMLSQKNNAAYFRSLNLVVVDEWHELLGTKRAVQVELAISRLKSLSQRPVRIWGISATIGNLEQAAEVLVRPGPGVVIRADMGKKIRIQSILPEEVEKFPWAGYLGIRLLDRVMPVIRESRTTLLFTNTRSQAEIWYQKILLGYPEMAGIMAMHHGSLDNEVRAWVEEALHEERLKLVVCTSSLDLGVDFRPVDTVIQVGSPRGIARFLQRAGRSGHQPGAESSIYFVPTHSLELMEGAALRTAILQHELEERKPLVKSLDVLVQYLVTLAVGDGFEEGSIKEEIRETYSFRDLSDEEWEWMIRFITTGGKSLTFYDEFSKVSRENNLLIIRNKRMAMRHRMSVGTIVGDPFVSVKYMKGGFIGTVEEGFISRLKPGDSFWFSGRNLEFVRFRDMTALVKKSDKKKGLIPQWMGGRMPLSSKLSEMIRKKLDEYRKGTCTDPEMIKITPMLQLQDKWSVVPDRQTLLIEKFRTRDGFHTFIYPFEGRFVHEVLAALVAYRLSQLLPNSFSIAVNDYGFELLSVKEYILEEALETDLFSTEGLYDDLNSSINQTQMAKRRFRDIAAISGLVFQGFPGKPVSNKHLQASSQILFDVFSEYDPGNLLVKQAAEEVITLQLEQSRLVEALNRINGQKIVLKYPPRPTPFSFPIMVDRLRERLSNEKLIDRVTRMQLQLEKFAGRK